ncbi:minor tail protein [Microbacterium phage Hendrix]|uniref:Minor tail protein n=1 Tax=Microbacterium phage Hendrix TaxID=2182341 RepID=A0A2U8UU94_9CAUD|nr:minor tail protein [Microbacterium phage Hendrix]AWN07744.1 minor tail protein [Microbacterium phage Hendrix]
MMQGVYGEQCISRHSVMIHDRGGKRRIDALVDVTLVRWGRTLSGSVISEIRITGKKACREQLDKLVRIKARRHEVVIFRGLERVFEGPILRVKWLSNGVVILAKDVTEYLAGTSLSKHWPGPKLGGPKLMTTRVQQIITHELTTPYTMRTGTTENPTLVTVKRWEQMDPPINVLPHLEVRPSATLETTANTQAFEMSVLDELYDRAQSSLNYTTIGRKIVIWDTDELFGKTRKLTDADFYGEIEVYEDGSEFSSINHLSAQRDDEVIVTDPGVTQGVGHAGSEDPYFGVWEYIQSSSSEEGSEAPTQAELNSQARRIDRTRRRLPLVMAIPGSSGIRLSDDLTIMQLIPGVVMPVSAIFNLREVTQDQILTDVMVEETSLGETIQVGLSPSGPLTEAA